MEQEDINYKVLREIQQNEKNSSLLTVIDKHFYTKYLEYVKSLKAVVKKEKDEHKIKLFNDEIENTEKIALNIYELREKKITQIALSKIRGGKPDLKNLLYVEKKLFDSLVVEIDNCRKQIFDAKNMAKSDEISSKPKHADSDVVTNKNSIVRVVQSTPEFVGTDMKTYMLRKDDVLTLSDEMSKPLIKRDVVRQIK